MEEKLLKIIKLANELNEKQDKVYAQIEYSADRTKKLGISIRKKKDFTYVKKCELNMDNEGLIQWDDIISILEKYIGGAVIHE